MHEVPSKISTTKKPFLSVIVPFYIKNKNNYIFTRVLNLLHNTFPDYIEVIFVDSTKDIRITETIKKNCNSIQKKYIHVPQKGVTYSLAEARNHGSLASNGEYIFFMDVDFIYSNIFWDTLHQKILNELSGEKNKYKFLMLPCLYLNKKTTEQIKDNREWSLFKKIRNNLLEGDNRFVETIAISSSTIVLRRKYFMQIGGFNTQYKGHGREEFDLLHRLSINYPIGKRPNDYHIDAVRHFPAKYKGFRKYFAYYALPLLFESLFLLHLHHNRSRSNVFYQNRKNNEKIFQINIDNYNKGKGLDPLGHEKAIPLKVDELHQHSLPPIKKYIEEIQNTYGLDINTYIGLFHYNAKPKVKLTNITRNTKKIILKSQDIFIGLKNNFYCLTSEIHR